MNLDLFRPRWQSDPLRAAAVKSWAAEVFRLAAEVSVMVTELRCTEPGCLVDLDLSRLPRLFEEDDDGLQGRAIADVTFADVLQASQGQGATK
jgi:hypothetical protein